MPKLPAVLRDTLLANLRETVLDRATPEVMAGRLAIDIASWEHLPGGKALHAVVGVATPAWLRALCESLPATHRAAFALDALSVAAGIEWEAPMADATGAVRAVRIRGRARLNARLEALRRSSFREHDDEPEAEDYAGALFSALAAIAHREPVLAARMLGRTVDGRSFRDALFAAARELADPGALLPWAVAALEIEWLPDRPTRPRVFRPADSFAVDDVIDHPTYGVGTVLTVARARITAQFAAGVRTLVTLAS